MNVRARKYNNDLNFVLSLFLFVVDVRHAGHLLALGLGHVHVAVLPGALAQLARAVADVLAVHFAHGHQVVVRVLERHKPVALGLAVDLVADHARLEQALVLGKRPRQRLVANLVAQIAHKNPKVVW